MPKCKMCKAHLNTDEFIRYELNHNVCVCDKCARSVSIAYAMWHGGSADTLRVLDSEVPSKTRKAITSRDSSHCLCCGTENDLTIDHIIPRSQGGDHSLDNLQTLCRACNSKKGTQTISFLTGA